MCNILKDTMPNSKTVQKRLSIFKNILLLVTLFLIGVGTSYSYLKKPDILPKIFVKNQDVYTPFMMEIYDKIKENYWDNVTDEQLASLYKLATEKFTEKPQNLTSKDRIGTQKLMEHILMATDRSKRRQLSIDMAGAILATLNPTGRSGLYNQKLETQLKNTVSNINPQKDLYKDLGLNKGASPKEVADAYQKQAQELEKVKDSSPEANRKLQEISYAQEVLSKPETKANYDSKGIEPTASSRLLTANVYYLKLDKFSPTTFDEFQRNAQAADKTGGPTSLIIDLRGNMGGAIDITPNFLGVFIGKNQYAFDFFHKGDYIVFRTPVEKLAAFSRYNSIVILVDSNTQSSAEILAAAFKRSKVGILLGVPTKGWGTVERVFPLDHQIDPAEKYSMFLVHSVTIRDDGLPIEGRGVEPDVNTKETNWKDKLSAILKNPELEGQVTKLLQ